MNILVKYDCRGYQPAFRLPMPLLPIGLGICGPCACRKLPEIRREDIPHMAAHAAREAPSTLFPA